jgi:hypothetical protein
VAVAVVVVVAGVVTGQRGGASGLLPSPLWRPATVTPSDAHVVDLHALPRLLEAVEEFEVQRMLLVGVVSGQAIEVLDEPPGVALVDHRAWWRLLGPTEVGLLDLRNGAQAPETFFELGNKRGVGVGLEPEIDGVNQHGGSWECPISPPAAIVPLDDWLADAILLASA